MPEQVRGKLNAGTRKLSSVKKVVTKISLRENKSDFAYWQTQPYAARLAALEVIRQEYHRWKYGVQPRFQRVYRVVKQKQLRRK